MKLHRGMGLLKYESLLSTWLCAQSCLTLCNPRDCSPPGSSVHGILQARLAEWGCHFLLQGIFPTQGLNPCLLHLLYWQVGSLPLYPVRRPINMITHTSIHPTCIGGYNWLSFLFFLLFFWCISIQRTSIFFPILLLPLQHHSAIFSFENIWKLNLSLCFQGKTNHLFGNHLYLVMTCHQDLLRKQGGKLIDEEIRIEELKSSEKIKKKLDRELWAGKISEEDVSLEVYKTILNTCPRSRDGGWERETIV